jgi:hypothetical protein
MSDIVECEERSFLLGFWSGTYRTACKDEKELRALATKFATERRTVVGFYEVVDGKTVRLGAVSGVGQASSAVVQRRGRSDAEASMEGAAVSYTKAPTSFWESIDD